MFLKIGHRGAKGLKTENTIESFNLAIELGCNAIEFDVRKSKDNKLIILHDDNLKRVWGKNLFVKNLTLKQLKEISNNLIPTLEETLDFIYKKVEKILIEIKEEGYEENILKIIKNKKILDKSILISFSENSLKKVRMFSKNIETGFIYVKHKNPLKIVKEIEINYVLPFYRFVHSKDIQNYHKNNIKVLVWTINKKEEILEYFNKGVDGIATDFPNLFKLIKLIKEK